MIDWKKWRHVTKLDPDKPVTAKDVAAIVDSGTDAIMVSGTQNITKENVANLVNMLGEYRIPKVLEPAGSPGMRDDLALDFDQPGHHDRPGTHVRWRSSRAPRARRAPVPPPGPVARGRAAGERCIL